MSISTQDGLQSPGELNIEQLFLVTIAGVVTLTDYLIELNI